MRLAWIALALVVAAGAGCKAGPPKVFRAKAATTVEVEGFSMPIPDGYRNLAELLDQDRAMKIQDLVPVDASVVVSETRPPEALWIAVQSFDGEPIAMTSAAECTKLADEVGQRSHVARPASALEPTPFGTACTYALDYPAEHDPAIGDVPGRRVRDYWIAINGKVLVLECGSVDAAGLDRGCKEFFDAAAARK